MMKYGRMLLLILWLGVVGGCGELRMPKREPLTVRGGGSELEADLAISTNCLEVGETLTITLTLTNTSPAPVVLGGHPPVDMIIQRNDRSQSPLADRWSASPEYPQSFDSTFASGESRDYQWHWIAREDFAREAGVESGATVRYVTEEFSQGGAFLRLGVHWYTDGGYVVTCNQLR